MKTTQHWFWPAMMQKIDRSFVLRINTVPVLCAVIIMAAPVLPTPFGFASSLVALLFGPAWALPALLFPRKALTLPESALIIVLGSVFVDTCTLFILNNARIPLTTGVISLVTIGSSYLLAIIASKRTMPDVIYPPIYYHKEHWLAFACGIGVAIVVSLCIYLLRG